MLLASKLALHNPTRAARRNKQLWGAEEKCCYKLERNLVRSVNQVIQLLAVTAWERKKNTTRARTKENVWKRRRETRSASLENSLKFVFGNKIWIKKNSGFRTVKLTRLMTHRQAAFGFCCCPNCSKIVVQNIDICHATLSRFVSSLRFLDVKIKINISLTMILVRTAELPTQSPHAWRSSDPLCIN